MRVEETPDLLFPTVTFSTGETVKTVINVGIKKASYTPDSRSLFLQVQRAIGKFFIDLLPFAQRNRIDGVVICVLNHRRRTLDSREEISVIDKSKWYEFRIELR
jgi:hypothetical protein